MQFITVEIMLFSLLPKTIPYHTVILLNVIDCTVLEISNLNRGLG